VTAKSVNLWRIQHALIRTGDMRKARKYHGGRQPTCSTTSRPSPTRTATTTASSTCSRRDNEELLATVTTKGFYDRSFTDKGRRQRQKTRR
jgi:hypothetical protein